MNVVMNLVMVGDGKAARPKVTAVDKPLIVDCTHSGCKSSAHYHVHTQSGNLIPRCWKHLKQDFNIDRLNPVNG